MMRNILENLCPPRKTGRKLPCPGLQLGFSKGPDAAVWLRLLSGALPLSGAILLGSSFVAAPPAVAQQIPERCYVHNDPDDSFPLTEEAVTRLGRIPATTAAAAASDPAKLPDFAREVKNYIENWKDDFNEWGIGRCILEESPIWNSGSIYVATIRPDGYVTLHAKKERSIWQKN